MSRALFFLNAVIWLALGIMILSHIDRILITVFLPEIAEDVAGVWQAWAMRQGSN